MLLGQLFSFLATAPVHAKTGTAPAPYYRSYHFGRKGPCSPCLGWLPFQNLVRQGEHALYMTHSVHLGADFALPRLCTSSGDMIQGGRPGQKILRSRNPDIVVMFRAQCCSHVETGFESGDSGDIDLKLYIQDPTMHDAPS